MGKITRRFHVLARAHRRQFNRKKFERAQRRLITAYFCHDDGVNITRFAEYGLTPELDKREGWSLHVNNNQDGIAAGTRLDQTQLFSVIFGDLCVQSQKKDVLGNIKKGLQTTFKERAPIQSAKLAAGSLALVVCPAGFAVVMATYSMARTINGSRHYLQMREEYDQADAMSQAYMKDKLLSAETFSKVTAPAILDALTMGLLDSSITDDVHDIVTSMKREVDISLADDVMDSATNSRPVIAGKKQPVLPLANRHSTRTPMAA